MCLENGSYLANYARCKECSQNNIQNVNIETHDDSDDSSDDEDCEVIENIRYNHTCVCSHLIAKHKVKLRSCWQTCTMELFQYKFWIEDGRQEYRMDCMLCGIAEDSSSILPHDPRKASTLEC